LLDALGKSQNKSIIEYFPKDFLTGTVFYSATFPLTHKQRILEICRLCKKMEINKLRIKVGKDFTQNKEILEAIGSVFGDDYDLRVDINGSWNRELAFNHIRLLKEYKVKIIEQPMMPDDPDLADFAGVMQSSGVILMADESACSLKDVKKISQEGYYEMVNVRLSKCGGFRRSLELIDYLRTKGIRFQIAGHLGESGILSAAGRALCLLCGDAVYYDGSYDEFLLKENITHENVSFGSGGKAGPLTGPGLGVEVNRQNLARLSEISESITSPATLKQDLLLRN
jgi:L-alanine-DL-glutamate epimerase-like enolase superfamily enzyme